MREHILNEIKRLANSNNGKALGSDAFSRETGIRTGEWLGVYWARWGDAVAEAGLVRNEKKERLSEDAIMTGFANACRRYGRLPTEMELRIERRQHTEFPAPRTLYSHFGGRINLEAAFRTWVEGRAEFADLHHLVRDVQIPISSVPASRSEGWVYLIRSGGFFKIGRSDEIERRLKEIRVALPDAATLIHSIRTDDPAGIENYWHRRFADRRANGEWFKLGSQDVAAFKRRKFQ